MSVKCVFSSLDQAVEPSLVAPEISPVPLQVIDGVSGEERLAGALGTARACRLLVGHPEPRRELPLADGAAYVEAETVRPVRGTPATAAEIAATATGVPISLQSGVLISHTRRSSSAAKS